MNDDWFASAATEAASTDTAREMRERAAVARKLEELQEQKAREAQLARRKDPIDVFDALKDFGEKLPTNNQYDNPRASKVTADMGLAAIEAEVRRSKEPYKTAGDWIAKVTNALSLIASESLDE